MSEYQYYEFRAVDRPLAQWEMDELRACSSRARISPHSFVNFYNWGNFKGDPDEWMEKYFDAFLYLANWGTRWLMLRVPKRLLDPGTAREYCTDDALSCRTKGDHLILSFLSEEEADEWDEEEHFLASLLPLRSDLMQGDYRCLYLGWLLAVQVGEVDDDDLEPPLPPGLGALNAQLRSLVDFLNIDLDLIAAAEEKSKTVPARGLSKEDTSRWLAKLPSSDKDDVLMRLLGGEDPHVGAELRNRMLREIRGEGELGSRSTTSARRTAGQLLARCEVIEEQRRKRQDERQARERAQRERTEAEERRKRLESLAGKENAVWEQVDKLIGTRQPARYDEAVALLKDLHDLAHMKGTSAEFGHRMNALYREHAKKVTLLDRFREADLSS
ncbi:MAG: hypothetical protein HY913_17195 [Desulfomonile tiedjei]|nr:hypothetical protein [Desulfomonile tiedjei]